MNTEIARRLKSANIRLRAARHDGNRADIRTWLLTIDELLDAYLVCRKGEQ